MNVRVGMTVTVMHMFMLTYVDVLNPLWIGIICNLSGRGGSSVAVDNNFFGVEASLQKTWIFEYVITSSWKDAGKVTKRKNKVAVEKKALEPIARKELSLQVTKNFLAKKAMM